MKIFGYNILFAFIFILFITLGLVNYYEIKRISTFAEKIHEHPLTVSNAALEFNLGMIKLHRDLRDIAMIVTGCHHEEWFLEYDEEIVQLKKSKKSADDNLHLIKTNILGEEGKQLIKSIHVIYDNLIKQVDEVLVYIENHRSDLRKPFKERIKDHDHETAYKNIKLLPEAEAMELSRQVDVVVLYARNKSDNFISELEKERHDAQIKLILTCIFGLMLSISAAVITTRKHRTILEKLTVSRIQFQQLMHQSPAVIEIYDKDGLQIEVNSSYEKLWGFPASHTVGEFNVLNSDEVKKKGLYDYVIRAYQGEAVSLPIYEFDSRGETEADGPGRIRWLKTTIYPLKDNNHNVINVVITHEDVTEMKITENKLEDSENRSSVWLENSPVCTKIIDLDLKLQYISKAGTEALNIITDELIGKQYPFDFYPQEFKDTMRGNLLKVIETKEIIIQEDPVVDSTGETIWFHSTIVPVIDNNNKVEYLIVVSMDTTDRHNAEEENERLESQVRRASKMDALGVMAGGIAHDFNNILGAILGYSEMIRDDKGISESTRGDIGQVLKASVRAQDLVARILTFSKKNGYQRTPMQLQTVVDEAVDLIKASTPTTIELIHNTNKVKSILGDPTQIHQIVVNLCTNSNIAMDDNGTLEISLTHTELIEEDLYDYPKSEPGIYAHLKVTDTGCGIDVDNIERIFDPYFTTNRKKKGNGMGLAVCLGIIKSHDAIVTVKSIVGEGSTFNIYFPTIDDEPITSTSNNNVELPTGTERIMVVDDEKPLSDLTAQRLSMLGYDVIACTDPEAALTLFENDPENYDMIITDQTMPNMTGKELTVECKEIKPDIHIIITSGYSSSLGDDPVTDLDLCGFIGKPVCIKDLSVMIRGCFDKIKDDADWSDFDNKEFES